MEEYVELIDSLGAIAQQLHIYNWYEWAASDLMIVEGGVTRDSPLIPRNLSAFAAMQQQWLEVPGMYSGVVLCWCCSLHLETSIPAMVISLIGQLLSKLDSGVHVLEIEAFRQSIETGDVEVLLTLLHALLMEQLQFGDVVCIIENITFYEDGLQHDEVMLLFDCLVGIVRLLGSNGVHAMKVLLPTETTTLEIGDKAVEYGFPPPQNVMDAITVDVVHT